MIINYHLTLTNNNLLHVVVQAHSNIYTHSFSLVVCLTKNLKNQKSTTKLEILIIEPKELLENNQNWNWKPELHQLYLKSCIIFPRFLLPECLMWEFIVIVTARFGDNSTTADTLEEIVAYVFFVFIVVTSHLHDHQW